MPDTEEIKANVLYVDDLKTNLILFQASFESDYNILLAKDGYKALEILKNQDIQVVVSDQRMPEMSGNELLEIVSREYPDVRRFLLTAFTDYETVVEAVNKGKIHGYINKPIKADELKATINNSLELYYLRRKNQEIMEELARANTELKGLDGLKSQIIKVISQEIRSPLNRIMGTLHLLKDKIESDELINVVNILDNSVSKLEEFSSMTEQISILKSPGHQIKFEEVPLKRLLEYSFIEASEELKEQGVEIIAENALDGISISGESHLLVSCLVYLIKNAAQHTNPGETIQVRTGQLDGNITCEVIDQGRNYDAEYMDSLLKHYSSKEIDLNLDLGIELALSEMIIEAHGGEIDFSVSREGKASVRLAFTEPQK